MSLFRVPASILLHKQKIDMDEKSEKGSVLDDLKTKKDEVAKKQIAFLVQFGNS